MLSLGNKLKENKLILFHFYTISIMLKIMNYCAEFKEKFLKEKKMKKRNF